MLIDASAQLLLVLIVVQEDLGTVINNDDNDNNNNNDNNDNNDNNNKTHKYHRISRQKFNVLR